MKVLFIQNNGLQESIGIANLSGILKANGHETDLLLVSHTRIFSARSGSTTRASSPSPR